MTLEGDTQDGYQKLLHGDQRALTVALDKAKEELSGKALRAMKKFEDQLRDECRHEWQALDAAGSSATKRALKRRAKIVNLEAKLHAARKKVDVQLRQTSTMTAENEKLEAEIKALTTLLADPNFAPSNLVTAEQLADTRALLRRLRKDEDDYD